MNLMSLFRRRNSAPVARERLQVLLAHERAFVGKSDLLAVLQEEIIAVIAKHVTIERDRVQIKLDRGDPISTLEIDVEVPSAAAAAALREAARPAMARRLKQLRCRRVTMQARPGNSCDGSSRAADCNAAVRHPGDAAR